MRLISGSRGRDRTLWFLLLISASAHFYLLTALVGHNWPVAAISTPTPRLEIRLLDTTPVDSVAEKRPSLSIGQSRDTASVTKANRPLSRQAKAKNRDATTVGQPLSRKGGAREIAPSASVAITSEPSMARLPEAPTVTDRPTTLNATALIENSLAMVHDNPYLGTEEFDDFTKDQVMKRMERIRQIFPALLEQPQLRKEEGVEAFSTQNGDIQVTLTLAGGKRVCFDVPKHDLATPDLRDVPVLWRFMRCKKETAE